MNSFFCLDCISESTGFSNVHELEAHIASDHLNLCPYECEKCRFAKFPTEYTLVSHCKADHGMFEFTIKYRYTPEIEQKRSQLSDRLQKCLNYRAADIRNRSSAATPTSTFVAVKTEEHPQTIVDNPPIPMSPHDLLGFANYQHYEEPMLMRCPQEEGNGGGSERKKRSSTMPCTMCGDHISQQRSSMLYHVNTRHSKFDMYECGICHKTWQTIAKSDVLKHLKTHHENPDGSINPETIIDNRRALSDKLKEATMRCFPGRKSRRQPLCRGTSPVSVRAFIENNKTETDDLDFVSDGED
ncbi:unnamed protein product [Caenorhabditis angaria]|uniref:C2H2-type domain-containing protein n=1 Tax=Caenorhabditis angaria TaxID=860376 RepID=A0A9P1IX60_9PELO|nr:unnamed protein product [Caenorhabditis angaria]